MDNEIRIIQINTAHADYVKELELRDEVLRKPIGLSIYDEKLDEAGDVHLLAYSGDAVVGCLILTAVGEGEVKMRQVAVKEKFRGQGVGHMLVEFSEKTAKDMGYTKIVLNARKESIGFYLKAGYQCCSDEFLEVGIPHRKMCKIT